MMELVQGYMINRGLPTFIFLYFLLIVGCTSEQQSEPQELPVYSSYYDTIPFEKGEALVSKHCKSCHGLADPTQLTKYNWEQVILPYKARLLGVKMSKSYPFSSQRTPSNAHLFSNTPVLPQEDWDQLVSYFVHQAPVSKIRQSPRQEPSFRLSQFEVKALPGQRFQPYASLLQIDEHRQRIYLGDGQRQHIQVWTPSLELEETLSVNGPPVHLRWDEDGKHLVLIKSSTLPSDYRLGQLTQLSPKDTEQELILSELPYALDFDDFDMNQDGKKDILLSEHGLYVGSVSAYIQMSSGEFEKQVLLNTPGAIKTEVQDLNADSLADILTLFGQAQERVGALYNQGEGIFKSDTILQLPPTFGSTDFQLLDVNGDGFQDILHTSGKNTYPIVYKDFHGLRIYLNDGKQHFEETFFYPLNGANHLSAADYDEDGDIDIAVTSFFPDYKDSPYEAFVYLENNGDLTFSPKSFEKHPRGKWGFMRSGDIDGDGDIDIVLANSMLDAEKDSQAHQKLWIQGTPALVILENQLR